MSHEDDGDSLARFLVAGALLTLFVTAGGATRQGAAIESLLQLVALLVLLWHCWMPGSRDIGEDARVCLLWLAALVVVLMLQLVPLPPPVWESLAGRAELAEQLASAGVAPIWRPLSLDPQATLRALLAISVPAAMFLVAAGLPLRRRVQLLRGVVVLAVCSALLGFAQLAGGPESPLRWHPVTSTTNAVGPFANRNHLATLLAVAFPLGAAWLMSMLRDRRPDRRAALLLVAVFVLGLLVVGLAVTRSRAGVLLGGAALIGIGAMVWHLRQRLEPGDSRPRQVRRWLVLAVFAGAAVSVQYGMVDLWGRLSADPLEDRRWTIASTTIDAIGRYGLLGSGGGTFPSVYPIVEPPSDRSEYYVNRAHNDWLEWLLEGGLPMLILLLVATIGLARMARSTLRSTSRHAPWQIAAAIGVGIIALHSAIDYPLRTTAIACIAALLVAVMLPEKERIRLRRKRTTGDLIIERDADGVVVARSSIPGQVPDPGLGMPREQWESLRPSRVAIHDDDEFQPRGMSPHDEVHQPASAGTEDVTTSR